MKRRRYGTDPVQNKLTPEKITNKKETRRDVDLIVNAKTRNGVFMREEYIRIRTYAYYYYNRDQTVKVLLFEFYFTSQSGFKLIRIVVV